MSLSITALYAGLLGLLFVTLSLRVIQQRITAKISVGDGDNKELRKRIRVQGNCAEYMPIGLLLLAMTELQGAPTWVVHLLGLMLLVGRVLHALGLGSTPQIVFSRRGGMVLTLLMITLASLANIGHALF